jgi:N-acetylneuraminate epimerase
MNSLIRWRFSRGTLRAVFGCCLLTLPPMTVHANSSTPGQARWVQFAPIPDPVGFGGMAAGVLDGRLVAAGGSQWDRPVWAGGKRLLSDRIFVLDAPNGQWRVHSSVLPIAGGHFATASTENCILIAGGLGANGTLATAAKLEGKGSDIRCTPLPSLPSPLVYAAAAVAGGRFYVIGGLPDPASKEPSAGVWSLGLNGETAWRREADLPEGGRFVMAAGSDGTAIYAFGGMAFDAAGKPVPSKRAYRLKAGRWEILTDLPAARVGAVSPALSLPGGRMLLAGGYAEVFGGAPREHPGFPRDTFIFDATANAWTAGPDLHAAPVGDRDLSGDPGPLPMIGAPGVLWRDHYVVINGEVRIATRTPAVVALPLSALR